MFGPDWQAGCDGCSWVVDAMTHPAHLHARDTTLVLVSRASREKLLRYQARMGWQHPTWYSSLNGSFNQDMGVTSCNCHAPDTDRGERHGISVFLRDGERIYRTYFSGKRGVEYLGSLLVLPGPDALRSPGELGGLTGRLAADATLWLEPTS